MSGSDHGDAAIWGRRAYVDKSARELLNDISRWIARTRPDGIEDPTNPALSDVLVYAGPALSDRRDPDSDDIKAGTLTELIRDHGLDFQEAVCWYWFRYCRYDITEIHYAMTGCDTGGDPEQRRNSVRNILAVLKSAASKVPDEDPDDVPDLVDERKRHDRTDDPDATDGQS